jgi:hypothetical protein
VGVGEGGISWRAWREIAKKKPEAHALDRLVRWGAPILIILPCGDELVI